MNPYFWMLLVNLFLLYWLIVMLLDRKGILERYNISAAGPVLMIRTKRGERLLERLSRGAQRERFWRIYATIGTGLVFIAMIFMFILVIYGAYSTFILQPTPTTVNEPRNWLLIPGLNEFIPMCAWVGFVIALVVHELSHAVLSTVEKITVKSMGLLMLIVPIGAFAEPDSEQLFGEKERKERKKVKAVTVAGSESREPERPSKKVATAQERTRILSAGVTSNFCVAVIAFALFFAILFSIQPVDENVLYVYQVATGSPAEQAGISSEVFIIRVDGTSTRTVEELTAALSTEVEHNLVVLEKNGKERAFAVSGGTTNSSGLFIFDVVAGLPADQSGLTRGMRITSIDDVKITGYTDFSAFMNTTVPGQVIEVQTDATTVTVPLAESPSGEETGYMGVIVAGTTASSPRGMLVLEFPAQEYLNGLRGIPASFLTLSPRQWLASWLWLTIMPIAPLPTGFGGFNPLLAQLFEPVGTIAELGSAVFWFADIFFWIGWINFYVGLFNCLPAIPLDGGYVFREMLYPVVRLGIKEQQRKEKVARGIAALFALFIFSAIVIILAGPYLL
ncbi:MAG: site-2 protease family protein [Methanomicrobia archaeon]|nr:site-2 protease family protein [Methanomicrobia archaeon]